MTVLQALVLGLVQGVTEFLPISSSGHLIIIPEIFNFESSINFDIFLHLGSATALVIVFFNTWISLFINIYKDIKNKVPIIEFSEDSFMLIKILVANIPILIIGFVFRDFFTILRNPYIVSLQLVIVSAIMWVAETKYAKFEESKSNINFVDAIIIGISQVIALIPGTSRSAITISTGLYRGINRKKAARFTFLLVTPLIILISVYEFLIMEFEQLFAVSNIAGYLSALIFSMISIKFLLSYFTTNTLRPFIIYRIILAIVILITLLIKT